MSRQRRKMTPQCQPQACPAALWLPQCMRQLMQLRSHQQQQQRLRRQALMQQSIRLPLRQLSQQMQAPAARTLVRQQPMRQQPMMQLCLRLNPLQR